MNRHMIVAGLVMVALLVGAVATRGFGLIAPPPTPLRLYGNVDIRQVDLAFRVGGRLASLAVDEGARVTPGQALAALDAAPLREALASTSGQLAQAEATLAKLTAGNRTQEVAQADAALVAQAARSKAANAEAERLRGLAASGATSTRQLEAAVAEADAARALLAQAHAAAALAHAGFRAEDIAAARASVAAARAARDRAATDLADATLTAPEPGVVLSRAREPGAIVQPGEIVYTVALDQPLRVRAFVAEADLPRVAPGMAVEVRADGNPRTYHGTIGAIAAAAEFTPKSVQTESLRADLVYRVRVIVIDGDGRLRQGEPVTVTAVGRGR